MSNTQETYFASHEGNVEHLHSFLQYSDMSKISGLLALQLQLSRGIYIVVIRNKVLVTLSFWNFGCTPIRLQDHQKQMRLPLNCLNRAGNSMTAVVNSVFTSFFVLLHLFSICCLFFFVCQQSCLQGSNKP